MGIWKRVVIVLLVLAVACSASDQESSGAHGQILTENEAKQLAYSAIAIQTTTSPVFLKICGVDTDQTIREMLEASDAVYHEAGIWTVAFANCAFVVDDATGEVTRP